MRLVSAICPSCNASVQVDADSKSTVCNYCNSSIVIEDAINKVELTGKVEISNSPTCLNYIKLGTRSYEMGDYLDAERNFHEALVLEPDNLKAVFMECASKTMYCKNMSNIDNMHQTLMMVLRLAREKNITDTNILNNYLFDTNKIFFTLLQYDTNFFSGPNSRLYGITNYFTNMNKLLNYLFMYEDMLVNPSKAILLQLYNTIMYIYKCCLHDWNYLDEQNVVRVYRLTTRDKIKCNNSLEAYTYKYNSLLSMNF